MTMKPPRPAPLSAGPSHPLLVTPPIVASNYLAIAEGCRLTNVTQAQARQATQPSIPVAGEFAAGEYWVIEGDWHRGANQCRHTFASLMLWS